MDLNLAEGLGVGELTAGAAALSRPADEFENDPTVEAVWAVKAFEHAEVYFNLLCSVDPKILKLTPVDDRIYSEFRTMFPTLNVQHISEEELKSEKAKEEWRPFCNSYKEVVEDFSFATLLRVRADEEYSPDNSIIAPKIQFLAIELARNREGHNCVLRTKYKPKPRQKK
nr:EOG090X0HAI [Triops cancriformis]